MEQAGAQSWPLKARLASLFPQRRPSAFVSQYTKAGCQREGDVGADAPKRGAPAACRLRGEVGSNREGHLVPAPWDLGFTSRWRQKQGQSPLSWAFSSEGADVLKHFKGLKAPSAFVMMGRRSSHSAPSRGPRPSHPRGVPLLTLPQLRGGGPPCP